MQLLPAPKGSLVITRLPQTLFGSQSLGSEGEWRAGVPTREPWPPHLAAAGRHAHAVAFRVAPAATGEAWERQLLLRSHEAASFRRRVAAGELEDRAGGVSPRGALLPAVGRSHDGTCCLVVFFFSPARMRRSPENPSELWRASKALRTQLSSTPAQTPHAVSLHRPRTSRSLPCPPAPRERTHRHTSPGSPRSHLCLQQLPPTPGSRPGRSPSLRRGPVDGGTSNPSVSSCATHPRGFWFTTASWPSRKVPSGPRWGAEGVEGRAELEAWGRMRAGTRGAGCAGSQWSTSPAGRPRQQTRKRSHPH